MACQSSFFFISRFLVASAILLLFTPRILSILNFFWPLIVSTVLGVLAVLSFGRRAGVSTEQEDDISENHLANTDTDVSPAGARMEEIGDVLMVGNQEVGWLEWLHNEDMKKCQARDRTHVMHAQWDLDENDLAIEASMDILSSRPKVKSLVDADGPMFVEENSVHETVKDAIAFSSTTFCDDDICMRPQVNDATNLIALASPAVADSCGADGVIHEDVDVVRENAPLPLDIENVMKNSILTDELSFALQKEGNGFPAEGALVASAFDLEAVVCSDSLVVSRTRGNVHELEVSDVKSENMRESNSLDFALQHDSSSGLADGFEDQTSNTGMASTAQDESLLGDFALKLRDETTRESITTPQCGSKAVQEGKASKHTSVDGGEGKCLLPIFSSIASKGEVMNVAEVLEFQSSKKSVSLTLEQEAPVRHETEWHIHEEEIHEKDTRESNGSPIWDVSDEEESKSSLQFSFFHNGCLTLTQVKQEAGDVARQK